MQPLLSPIHIAYVTSDFTCHHNRLENLFALLDLVDPMERRWFVSNGLGMDNEDSSSTFEIELDRQYSRFQRKLARPLDIGARECSIVFMYVCETLNILRRLGCPVESRKRGIRIRETLAAITEFESHLLNPVTRRCVAAKLEEMLTNVQSDAELFRGRYQLFCNRIAVKLIQDPHSDQTRSTDYFL